MNRKYSKCVSRKPGDPSDIVDVPKARFIVQIVSYKLVFVTICR